MTSAEFWAQEDLVLAEATWWSARVVDILGCLRVNFGASRIGTFTIGPAGARAFAVSLLSAADEAEGKSGLEDQDGEPEDEAAAFDAKLRSILSTWGQSPAGEWPLTLTCGRDGIGYLAFPFDLDDVPGDVCERADAARWYCDNSSAPFGQGTTPEAALVSLREQAARIRADVARAAWRRDVT